MPTFRDKLAAAQPRNDSWLCVGLDPDLTRLPDLPAFRTPEGLAAFCRAIVEATADVVSAFKPNLAFFLAYGSAGVHALEDTLAAIPDDIPVILDAKSGDIGSTQRMYGQAAFEALGVDALTVSPYVGDDAVLPLLDTYPGKGLFVLARTSNPAAGRFQDHPGEPPHLYEQVVSAVQGWQIAHPESTLGLVVGATYEAELEALRGRAPELPFLVPGVGAQGGTLDAAVAFGATADGLGPVINASRSVIYASSGADFADAARRAAVELRSAINDLRNRSK
ncbi:MAG: orotidine-5'-phosphate decarboxylase [Chloroflexi bacterium]|nr:orotidine-5'-phosphate decarboxylase [Chloroflexota bacterium]